MNNEPKESYGARIKDLRIEMGMTQNQVAEALSVTPGYICNVENNRTAMSLRILTYFAKLTGKTIDELVGQLEPEYRNDSLDNALMEQIRQMDEKTKQKLLKTIELWNE
ncbi:MAG: helix-turn-helix transcriptional regulator [Agathobacter sp.]|nr:helix-turn-helix transcriptional regulator [Agathobacter sp.]